MKVGSGVVYEAIEEIRNQFGLKIADEARFHAVFVRKRGASPEVDGDDRERFVHREHEITGAIDSFAIAQSFGEELTDYNAGVFDGVVLIDVEIAVGFESQVEGSVFREQLEHVVEEADAGGDFVAAAAFDGELA